MVSVALPGASHAAITHSSGRVSSGKSSRFSSDGGGAVFFVDLREEEEKMSSFFLLKKTACSFFLCEGGGVNSLFGFDNNKHQKSRRDRASS